MPSLPDTTHVDTRFFYLLYRTIFIDKYNNVTLDRE